MSWIAAPGLIVLISSRTRGARDFGSPVVRRATLVVEARGERPVDLRQEWSREVVKPHVADDADNDGVGILRTERSNSQLLSDRIDSGDTLRGSGSQARAKKKSPKAATLRQGPIYLKGTSNAFRSQTQRYHKTPCPRLSTTKSTASSLPASRTSACESYWE